MKKLMITAVFALATLTATTAQETASLNTKAEATITEATITVANQDYVAVELKEVPQAILKAVSVDFEGATLSKAWKNAKNEYKLELLTADEKVMSVHANSKGEWLKKK